MKTAGYILLHRKIWAWEPWKRLTSDQKVLALYYLCKAEWRDTTVHWEGHTMDIERGSFISSTRLLERETGLSRRTQRSAQAALEKAGFLTRYPAQRATQLTITNYDSYQDSRSRGDPIPGPVSIYKEDKEERVIPLEAKERAKALKASILAYKPNHTIKTKSPPLAWAKDIEALHRIDGVSYERIDAVIAWLPTDVVNYGGRWKGWAPCIGNGNKLRAKFNQLEDAMSENKHGPLIPHNVKLL